jgi:hypothetical protein
MHIVEDYIDLFVGLFFIGDYLIQFFLCREREGWGCSVLVKSMADEVDDIASVI